MGFCRQEREDKDSETILQGEHWNGDSKNWLEERDKVLLLSDAVLKFNPMGAGCEDFSEDAMVLESIIFDASC